MYHQAFWLVLNRPVEHIVTGMSHQASSYGVLSGTHLRMFGEFIIEILWKYFS